MSRTESCGKTCSNWNVRLTPRRLRSHGRMPVVSLAVDADLAVGRQQLAEHAIEQRRFARAVRPDDAEDFAVAHLERHVIDRGDAAEALAQIGDFENRRHRDVTSGVQRRGAAGACGFVGLNSFSARPSIPVGQNAIIAMTSTA